MSRKSIEFTMERVCEFTSEVANEVREALPQSTCSWAFNSSLRAIVFLVRDGEYHISYSVCDTALMSAVSVKSLVHSVVGYVVNSRQSILEPVS